MKAAGKVKTLIKSKGTDTIWTVHDFPGLPAQAVLKTLSRLTQNGLLTRVRKGIYYYPAQTVLGNTVPSTSELIKKVLNRAESSPIYVGGGASFQGIGISTQVPAGYTVLSDGRSRKLRVGKFLVKIEHRPLSRWHNAAASEIAILDCLRHVKHPPDSTPEAVVLRILDILRGSPATANKITKFAALEPPRVRATVGAIADYLGTGNTTALRKSLNPLTKYKLGIGGVLPTAAHWGIV